MNTLKPIQEAAKEEMGSVDCEVEGILANDRTHTKEVLIERLRKEKQMWVKGIEKAELVSDFNDGIDQAIAIVEEVYKSE